MGFALATSASLLRAFNARTGPKNCLDVALVKKMEGTCSDADRQALEQAVQLFFCERKDAGAAEHGTKVGIRPAADAEKPAYSVKSKTAITDSWSQIFARRRVEEPDDSAPIKDKEVCARMYRQWMNEWLSTPGNLTAEQAQRRRNRLTSMFAAYIKNTVGGKNFLMAVWQSGITWAPSAELLHTNYGGVLEHVAKNFASWVRCVARAIRRHKEAPNTVAARIRSGNTWGQHGLTASEETIRQERCEARRNYFWALGLDRRLNASKGKGKRGASEHAERNTGKGKGKGKEHVEPKSWYEMTGHEQWYLYELWNGNLKRARTEAESKMSRVEADAFVFE
jgi:hypothetical protein